MKELYEEKFGESIDEESLVDDEAVEEGIVRPMEYGGVDGYAAGPRISYSALELKLQDVKQLYEKKFGERLDQESYINPNSTHCSYHSTFAEVCPSLC